MCQSLWAVSSKLTQLISEAPEFVDQSTAQEILITGIKVVDLLAPYAKGGKIGECSVKAVVTISSECFINCRSIWWCWSRQDSVNHGTY